MWWPCDIYTIVTEYFTQSTPRAWNMQKQKKKCLQTSTVLFLYVLHKPTHFVSETLNSLWPEQRKWVHASGNHSKRLWALGSGHRLDVCSFHRHLT